MKPSRLLCSLLSLLVPVVLFSAGIAPKVGGISEGRKSKAENKSSEKASTSNDGRLNVKTDSPNSDRSFAKSKVTDILITGLPVDANIADVIVIRSEKERGVNQRQVITTYFDPKANQFSYVPTQEVRSRFNATLTDSIYRDPPSKNQYVYTLPKPLDIDQEALIYIQPLHSGPQHFWRSESKSSSPGTLALQYSKKSPDINIKVPSDVRRHQDATFFNLSLRFPSELENVSQRGMVAISELRSTDLPMTTRSLTLESLAYPEGSLITARFQVFFPNDNRIYTYVLNESGQLVDTVEKE